MASKQPNLGTGARGFIWSAWLWLIFTVPSFTDAACNMFTFMLLLVFGLAIGVGWIWLTVVRPELLSRRSAKWWLSVPAAGLLGTFLFVSDRDLAARVSLSEVELMDQVSQAQAGETYTPVNQRVGLFWIRDRTEFGGGVYFHTSSTWINSNGIAHIPPGSQPRPRTWTRHLYGSWYWYEWKF